MSPCVQYELAVPLDIQSSGRIKVVACMVDIVVEKPENRKQELLARRIFDDPALQTSIKASKADRSRAHAAMQHLLPNLRIKTKSLETLSTTRVSLLNMLRSLGKSIEKQKSMAARPVIYDVN